ncbi:MAG: hypothetical protein KAS18_02525 [Calditrichia bacterium]|nr:hypothetical protein [Calditrichia bacterium]
MTKLLKYQLNKNGYKIVQSDNIDSAIEINKDYQFQVIVVDLHTQNNIEEIKFKLFKEINQEVIIIITVEFGNVDSAVKSCKMGID